MNEKNGALIGRLEALEQEVTRLRQELSTELSLRDTPASACTLLVCKAREVRFSLLLGGVEEVVPVARLTALPEAAPWILGTLNLRGESLAVIDAGHRLTGEVHPISPSERIVICATERLRAGLLVDEVQELVTVPAGGIAHPAPGTSFAAYLIGIVHHQKESLPVIDAARLLATSSLPTLRSGEVT